MKAILLFLWLMLLHVLAHSQPGIHTSGKYILGPCNDTLTLRGINYAPYNWGYSPGDIKIAELALSGANCVRIPWYQNNPSASVYANYAALDSALSQCVRYDMIPILELHDFTCGNNSANLVAGANWWISSPTLQVLNKYKHSLIVNIANEALQVNWAGDPASALAAYRSTYQTIIGNLRGSAGFDFPLMIDAPDCGTNSDAFITSGTAAALITADPKHNLIFSTHAYWYAYASNDSLQMAGKLNAVLGANIPFVLGEIANEQDDATMCQYSLNYKPLLNYCRQKNVGWIAWVWDHDGCPNRQVSSTGYFADLTAYGSDIVNNPGYGLKTHPAGKSRYLIQGSCAGSTGLATTDRHPTLSLLPNPSTGGSFEVVSDLPLRAVSAHDVLGHELSLEYIKPQSYRLNAPEGIYFITVSTDRFQKTIRLVLK